MWDTQTTPPSPPPPPHNTFSHVVRVFLRHTIVPHKTLFFRSFVHSFGRSVGRQFVDVVCSLTHSLALALVRSLPRTPAHSFVCFFKWYFTNTYIRGLRKPVIKYPATKSILFLKNTNACLFLFPQECFSHIQSR